MQKALQRAAFAKLRHGTEVLRTGGGVTLTAEDCNVVLDRVAECDAAEARTKQAEKERDEARTRLTAANKVADAAEARAAQLEEALRYCADFLEDVDEAARVSDGTAASVTITRSGAGWRKAKAVYRAALVGPLARPVSVVVADEHHRMERPA